MLIKIIFLALTAKALAIHTPVFILDDGLLDETYPISFNPFVRTSVSDFANIANMVQVRSTNMIFFIEDNFSVEDISSRDYKGNPFYHLRRSYSERKLKYLPKVVDPYGYLKGKFESFDFNTFRLRSTTTKLRFDENYKFLYIYFDDSNNESRVEALRRHDVIMKQVYFAVKQLSTGPVVAFYTGKRNGIELRSDFKEAPPLPTVEKKWYSVNCSGSVKATFKFFDAQLQNGIEDVMIPQKCRYIQKPSFKEEEFAYEVVFDSYRKGVKNKEYTLRFTFEVQAERKAGWMLKEVRLLKFGTISTSLLSVRHPWSVIYSNEVPLLMTPTEWYEPKVNIAKYQIKIDPVPPTKEKQTTPEIKTTITETPWSWKNEPKAKPKAWEMPSLRVTTLKTKDDVTKEIFVTIPILTTFLIVAILLFILFMGVAMMMSCKTNDRYDSIDTKPFMQTAVD